MHLLLHSDYPRLIIIVFTCTGDVRSWTLECVRRDIRANNNNNNNKNGAGIAPRMSLGK